MVPSKVFLVDVDDTLIDSKKVKLIIEKNFRKKFGDNFDTKLIWDTYTQVRSNKGFVDYTDVANFLSQKLNTTPKQIHDLIIQVSFDQCLIKSAVEFIAYLQTLGKIILFSQGETTFQNRKIRQSGLEGIVGPENILIIANKKAAVPEVINKLSSEGFKEFNFIDDRAEILDEAFLLDKSIKCYWVRTGRSKNILPQTSCVTFQSDILAEIYQFIYTTNTVDEITTVIDQKSELLKIKIGLSPNQVKQLITFTLQDKDVQKFTSDLNRFSNKKSFNNWLAKGKYIYSLVDNRDNLQGLIWFNEKSPPEDKYLQNIDQYKITLGIRIYGVARGKGLSKTLFSIALKHFKSTPEYQSITNHGFWVVISDANTPSSKLHENMGFVQVTKPNQDGKIVMVYT